MSLRRLGRSGPRALARRRGQWLSFCQRFDIAAPRPGFQLGALLRLAQIAGHEF
jgi:hypothetical protein